MGKVTGFLEYDRVDNKVIPVAERIKSFQEFHVQIGEEERKCQGARCMSCGVPLCQSGMKLNGMYTGCPLHNLIPEWNDSVYQGQVSHGLARLLKHNNFPEFTGRVCPALCEKACIEGLHDKPVSTHENELYLIEEAYKRGLMTPRIPEIRSGKKVAIVGAGPAGLAAADQLNHRGHSVTVFERDEEIGGLLMFGIPNMKLDKDVVVRRRTLMEQEGVVFRCGVNVGVDISAAELEKDFDAVILCCGAKAPRPLAAEGLDKAKSVYFAVDFLSQQTRALRSHSEVAPAYSAKGRNVVIIGGGDTGNDCVGTSIRQGCKSVTQVEMMPEPPVERAASNPWPEWPKVLKVDYGQQESIEVFGHDPRVYESTVKSVECDKKGNLKSVTLVKVKFENRQLSFVEGSEKTIPCELLLIAAGFLGAEKYVPEAFGTALSQRSTVVTADENHYQTQAKSGKVFTAGDMHRGQSLVVWAIQEGRACAAEVDSFLMGYSSLD